METVYVENTHLSNRIPALLPGCVYTRQDIIANLGVTPATVDRWEAAGLKPCQPGSKTVFYFSDDVMAVLRLDRTEIPSYKPKGKKPKE